MDQPLMERIEDGQEPCIRVHGVLLMRPKSWAKEPDNLERVYKTTRTLIRRAFPRPDMLKKGDDRLWPTMKKYFSFVMNLGRSVMFWFQPSDPLINSDMVLAELLADGARFCSEVGYQYEAVPMLVTAEKICKNLLAKRPLEVKALYPSVLSLLALYQCFGGIKGKTKATAYISRAISLQEEYMASLPANSVTPVDFLNLGIFYSDQACCYLECEKLSLAEPLLAKVLENYNHVGAQGSQPVRCGIAYSWQSLILAAKGSIKDADDFSKRGCELVRHTLGDSSRETLRITFQRALLMFYNGDRWDSINLHLKVLEEREQRLGLIDHETLSSKYCVAVSQHSLNKHEGAEYVQTLLRTREIPTDSPNQVPAQANTKTYGDKSSLARRGPCSRSFPALSGAKATRRGNSKVFGKALGRDANEGTFQFSERCSGRALAFYARRDQRQRKGGEALGTEGAEHAGEMGALDS